jgi:hypothetical protein
MLGLLDLRTHKGRGSNIPITKQDSLLSEDIIISQAEEKNWLGNLIVELIVNFFSDHFHHFEA